MAGRRSLRSPWCWPSLVALAVAVLRPRPSSARRRPRVAPPLDTDADQRGAARRPAVTEPPDPALAPFYSQAPRLAGVRGRPRVRDPRGAAGLRRPGGRLDRPGAAAGAGGAGTGSGSLVVNPGGPGSPGTDYAAERRERSAEAAARRLRRRRLRPPRHRRQRPVDCLSDEELDAYLAQDPDPDTAAEGATFAD